VTCPRQEFKAGNSESPARARCLRPLLLVGPAGSLPCRRRCGFAKNFTHTSQGLSDQKGGEPSKASGRRRIRPNGSSITIPEPAPEPRDCPVHTIPIIGLASPAAAVAGSPGRVQLPYHGFRRDLPRHRRTLSVSQPPHHAIVEPPFPSGLRQILVGLRLRRAQPLNEIGRGETGVRSGIIISGRPRTPARATSCSRVDHLAPPIFGVRETKIR